ncbi:hypothetical protein ACFY5K_09895 [Streptomyces griseofuscus]|uniref:hypothetical protein n=1 Tax=Streptomyces griseofuscus TaxID=146922 RepID=UPI0036BA2A41
MTVRDLDAPGGTFTHWLIRDLDAGTADCPPHGDRPHRHVLTVYATDRRPPLSPNTPPDASSGASSGASLDELRRALAGHTLATGTLTGRHGR